jgi:valyl-tRNA synthetase
VAAAGEFRDRWILSRLADAVATVDTCFAEFRFGEACSAVQNFWVGDLCNYYVEMIKPTMRGEDGATKAAARAVLFTCMDYGLRMLHPIMPFVTEELYHRLPKWTPQVGDLMIASYPKAAMFAMWRSEKDEQSMALMQAVTKACRSVRSSLNLTKKKVPLFVSCADAATLAVATEVLTDLTLMTSSSSCNAIGSEAKRPDGCLSQVIDSSVEIHVQVKGLDELAGEAVKREKQLAQMQKAVAGLDKKISNPGFLAKSTPEVQQELKQKLELKQEEVKVLEESIQVLLSMFSPAQKQSYVQAKIASVDQELKKAQGQLAKIEKNIKKNPKNKKNLKMQAAKVAEITALQERRAELAASADQ